MTLSAPDTKKGKLQRVVLEMLQAREDQPDALPTSVRFLFYELVQQGIIQKSRKSKVAGAKGRRGDQDLCEAVFWLREKGLIPWHWIEDETRSLSVWRFAPTVKAYLADTIDTARIDRWAGKPSPMILCESRSLAGVLRNLAYQYIVPIAPTNGQCGGFLRTAIAPALVPGQRVGYLGDWDLSGGQIEANTRNVLEQLIGGELDWHRIAITEQQVNAHDLPVISKPDKRYKPVRYHDAVETEALGQAFIVNLVRQWLDFLLPKPLADVLEREARQRAAMRRVLRRGGRS